METFLRMLASTENASEHVLGRAVLQFAEECYFSQGGKLGGK